MQVGATLTYDDLVGTRFVASPSGVPLAGALWITTMGTGAAGCAVVLAATALLWSAGRTVLVGPMWAVFGGAEATTWGIKFLSGRARPTFVEAMTEVSPSFPSAHATTAVAVYGFVAVAALGGLTGPRRRAVAAGALALALLIGLSRLVLSVHYLTDVLGGYLVGLAWLLAFMSRDRPAVR